MYSTGSSTVATPSSSSSTTSMSSRWPTILSIWAPKVDVTADSCSVTAHPKRWQKVRKAIRPNALQKNFNNNEQLIYSTHRAHTQSARTGCRQYTSTARRGMHHSFYQQIQERTYRSTRRGANRTDQGTD